jgi:hypothetical protein
VEEGKCRKYGASTGDISICDDQEEPIGQAPEAEDAAIAECPTEEAMLMRYMEKFPDSNRRALDVVEHWKTLRAGIGEAEA